MVITAPAVVVVEGRRITGQADHEPDGWNPSK
jgi:hypothetical protein